MKAVVAAFNQEKALVGAFSVIANLRMELFQALLRNNLTQPKCLGDHVPLVVLGPGGDRQSQDSRQFPAA